MNNQEKIIKLASIIEQVEKISVPAYVPMAKELRTVKEALLIIMQLLTEGGPP